MKAIKLKLFNDITDAYYYMGKLFVLTESRLLKTIDNQDFFQRYLQTNDSYENSMLQKVFFSNDQLLQQEQYAKDYEYSNRFDLFWNKYSNKKFEIQIEDEHLSLVCELPQLEALDFVIYAQRAYLANRDGMFECKMSIDGNRVQNVGGFQRVFDAKSININPRAGHLLVSTKSDGLFSASLSGFESQLRIGDTPIEASSVRTGWVNYDFVNYRNHTQAEFISNDVEDDKSGETNWFKIEDNSYNDKKITKIAAKKEDISADIAGSSRDSEVIFSFNSLSKSFAVTNDGKIHYSSFMRNSNDNRRLNKFLSFRNIKFDIQKLGRPLSAHTVSGGTVYEFFDQVILLKNGKFELLSNFECSQVRTFASSKWFQNITLTLGETCLEVHSIFPYQEPK